MLSNSEQTSAKPNDRAFRYKDRQKEEYITSTNALLVFSVSENARRVVWMRTNPSNYSGIAGCEQAI